MKIFRSIIFKLSFLFSCFGIFMLFLILFLSFYSIIGRAFLSQPIFGYFEVVELACASTIFFFLPLCQIKKGNLILEIFTSKLRQRKKEFLDTICYIFLSIIYLIFSFYMFLGALDMYRFDEQTMLLRFPIWIAFVPAVSSFILLFFISFFLFIESLNKTLFWNKNYG